jgi:hypothetical protein
MLVFLKHEGTLVKFIVPKTSDRSSRSFLFSNFKFRDLSTLYIKALRFVEGANFNRYFAVEDTGCKIVIANKLVPVYVCDFTNQEFSKKNAIGINKFYKIL